jgi:hypothetical protein
MGESRITHFFFPVSARRRGSPIRRSEGVIRDIGILELVNRVKRLSSGGPAPRAHFSPAEDALKRRVT